MQINSTQVKLQQLQVEYNSLWQQSQMLENNLSYVNNEIVTLQNVCKSNSSLMRRYKDAVSQRNAITKQLRHISSKMSKLAIEIQKCQMRLSKQMCRYY